MQLTDTPTDTISSGIEPYSAVVPERAHSLLNSPHGGELVNLLVPPEQVLELQCQSRDWPSWSLTTCQLWDLELLLNGGFSPLRGFMTRADYEGTCCKMRLGDGSLWPIPITLDVTEEFAATIGPGSSVALRDPEGVLLARLHVEEVWRPDRLAEGELIYGSNSTTHSSVARLWNQTRSWYVGGRLEGISLPTHYDFRPLRQTPAELRAEFLHRGWRKIVAIHARGLMHRAEQEATLQIAKQLGAKLLIYPSVVPAGPVDAEFYVRVRCYKALLSKYPDDAAKLSLIPLAERKAGSRETILRAIVAKNCGCGHFLDFAEDGPGSNAQPLEEACGSDLALRAAEQELGISRATLPRTVNGEQQDVYIRADRAPESVHPTTISRAELRDRLADGEEVPSWYTFPEVWNELRRTYPPRPRQGITVFFTGLSGSGKSTIANILRVKFLEMGDRPVTLLDGDIVRKHLSAELGFSREHRDINIRRIGFVASEITKNGGIAICAPIAPYDVVRQEVRTMIEPYGGFILVYLSTSLQACEARDRKGLYAKARAGLVPHFTGVDDPYEVPSDADVVIDTSLTSPQQASEEIFSYLQRRGFVGSQE